MERKDHLYPGGPCFYFDTDLFPPTTDSFALGYFARSKRGERVCDLGSGTGLLASLLLARNSDLSVECVEWDRQALSLAEKGFRENGWEAHIRLHPGDLRDAAVLPPVGSMDFVLSNPPYFSVGSGESAAGAARQRAREENCCTLDDLCIAAARILRWGGRFALVYRCERLSELFCALHTHGIEPKRVRFLAKAADAAPSLVLVEGRRGGKCGLTVEPPLIVGSQEWERVYFRA